MIYLILTRDLKYADRPTLRMLVEKKIENFSIVSYAETEDDAKNFCRAGGKLSGTTENRFWFFKINKIGEDNE